MIKKKNILKMTLLSAILMTGCVKDNEDRHSEHVSVSALGNIEKNTESELGNETDPIAEPEINNLDCTNAIIERNGPDSGKWYELEYDEIPYSMEYIDKLKESVEKLGYSFKKENSWFSMLDNSSNPPERIYLSGDKLSEQDISNPAYSTLITWYEDDDIHLEYNSGGGIEFMCMDRLKNALDVTPEKLGIGHGGIVRLNHLGKSIREVTSEQSNYDAVLDEEYSIDGTMMRFGDVISKQKESILCDSRFGRSLTEKGFGLFFLEGDIFELTNGECGVNCRYGVTFDGVPVADKYGSPKYDNQLGEEQLFYRSTIPMLCGTFTSKIDDYEWLGAYFLNDPEKREVENLLSFDEACKKLSEVLTENNVFIVRSAELQYVFATYQDNINGNVGGYTTGKLQPAWTFTITNLGMSDYGIMYATVIAETGRVSIQLSNH